MSCLGMFADDGVICSFLMLHYRSLLASPLLCWFIQQMSSNMKPCCPHIMYCFLMTMRNWQNQNHPADISSTCQEFGGQPHDASQCEHTASGRRWAGAGPCWLIWLMLLLLLLLVVSGYMVTCQFSLLKLTRLCNDNLRMGLSARDDQYTSGEMTPSSPLPERCPEWSQTMRDVSPYL